MHHALPRPSLCRRRLPTLLNQAPVLALATCLLAGGGPLQAQVPAQGGRALISRPSDLPILAFTLPGKPSEVVQNPKAVLTLAGQLQQELRRTLEACDIRDQAVLQGIHTDLYVIAVLQQDVAEARRQRELFQAATEDTTQRNLAGLIADPFLEAKARPGTEFHAAYRALLAERLAKLPFQEFNFALTATAASVKALSRAALVGSLEAGLDPQVKDGKLNQEAAEAILGTAYRLSVHEVVKADVVACIDALVEAHRNDAPVAFKPVLGTPKAPIRGAWFGQPLPGGKPVRFAAEILEAINPWAGGVGFSPDGKECLLGVGAATYSGSRLYHARCVDGVWTALVEPPFLAEFVMAGEPSFSPDGNTIVLTGKKAGQSGDLYALHRTATGWSAPAPLAASINSGEDEYRGSFLGDGTFYFGRNTAGKMETHKAFRNAAGAMVVEKLGPPINGTTVDGDPCIAPDGRWLVFYSARPGGLGRADLWVSFADGQGGWEAPVHLGPEFNGPDDEFGATLSPDGKLLFFTRHTPKRDETYWVAASAIDTFKRPSSSPGH